MAVDVREGDVLVVGTDEYPIVSCGEWAFRYGTGFARLATVTASTKRTPAIAAGKRGAPVENVSSLICTPLDPVDPALRQRLALDTPHELLQTFVDGGTTFYHLILEDLKR